MLWHLGQSRSHALASLARQQCNQHNVCFSFYKYGSAALTQAHHTHMPTHSRRTLMRTHQSEGEGTSSGERIETRLDDGHRALDNERLHSTFLTLLSSQRQQARHAHRARRATARSGDWRARHRNAPLSAAAGKVLLQWCSCKRSSSVYTAGADCARNRRSREDGGSGRSRAQARPAKE